MKYPDYLVHYNKNHSSKTGQFAPGDGDGDGVSNDHANQRKKGQYSAKIENYHKGNAFHEAYYIDKNGNKRSYMSYKEMPVDAQNAERARNKGKQVAKKVAGIAISTVSAAAIAVGATLLVRSLNNNFELEPVDLRTPF
jgi:hypothetical protein